MQNSDASHAATRHPGSAFRWRGPETGRTALHQSWPFRFRQSRTFVHITLTYRAYFTSSEVGMKQVTVLSRRWPYALSGILFAVLLMFPILLIFAPGVPRLKGDDLLALCLIETLFFTFWVCHSMVPVVRPRRLILTDQGVTLDTVWRRQHWEWRCVAGIWPLGGYKPHLEVNQGGRKLKRVFLGSFWPGDSVGLTEVVSKYRAQAYPPSCPKANGS